MIKLSPSILSADFVNLERDIRALTPAGADYVHVDVMDGLFVPNITIGIPVVEAIRKITDLPLDVHLMIDRPLRYVDDFCKAGSDILTIHVEADSEENTLAALKRIRENGVKAAISIKPKTPAEAVLPYLPYCDLILVMTVEPGFGGQAFMQDMMPKLKTIRGYIDAQNPACELEVDGGVNEEEFADWNKHIADWGIYVMVNRYGDRNGNNPCMPDGLVPNFTANDDPMDGYQLGDEQEALLNVALQHAGMKFDKQTTRTHSYPDVELTMIDTNPLSGKRIQLNTAMPAMVSIPTTTGM